MAVAADRDGTTVCMGRINRDPHVSFCLAIPLPTVRVTVVAKACILIQFSEEKDFRVIDAVSIGKDFSPIGKIIP